MITCQKQHVRKLLIILLISCFTLGILAAPTSKYCLVIEFKDGQKQAFQLSTRPNISFQGSQFVVAQDKSDVEFAFADVANFSFADSSSGVNALHQKNLTFSYTDYQNFVINGADGRTSVEVIGIDGKQQSCKVSRSADNTLSVSLVSLRPGVYMVRVNNKQIFKILKK